MRLRSILLVLTVLLAPAHADDNASATQLLASRYGELCTMCEGFLKCRSAVGAGAADDLTIYRVEIKDFWQQVATIGDWFMYMFRDVGDERRHLTIYTRSKGPGGRIVRAVVPDQQARLSLQRARIELPGGWVDRNTGSWHRDGAATAGTCAALSTADAATLLQGFGVARP